MLKLQEVSAFAPTIHQVVGDLLQRIELLRSRSRDKVTVSDMATELYKFGFEGGRSSGNTWTVDGRALILFKLPPSLLLAGISSILFETRLGCLQEKIPEDILRFIKAVNDMLTLSDTVILLPRWSRAVLPYWRRFVQAWDVLCDVGTRVKGTNATVDSTMKLLICLMFVCFCPAAQTLINRRVAEIEAQLANGKPVEGMYLTYLLSSDRLSRAEVYICITELLLGGVDTVRRCHKSPL